MNKGRILLFEVFVFLILASFMASASISEEINKNYINNYDTWVYKESSSGRKFTLSHFWSSPTHNFKAEDSGVTWRRYQQDVDQANPQSYSAFNSALRTFESRRRYPSYSPSYSYYGFSGGIYARSFW